MKTAAILILTALLDIVPGGKAYLKQLQPRDSILIADQVEYGFRLEGVKDGTGLALPDLSGMDGDTLALVRSWKVDTLKVNRRAGTRDIGASVILAPFEEGRYRLPDLFALRTEDGRSDTLSFEGAEMLVTAMPIDTATFVIRDLKGQIRYPVTFMEVLPWALGAVLLAALAWLAVRLVRRSRRGAEEARVKEPPYVTALRGLDRWRGDRHWAPQKQKAFYSGVTDILKEYIAGRFGVGAPEMTTAELFDALRAEKDITPENYGAMKDLFERADFVKFARMTASDEENATVIPASVKFVTDTWQAEAGREEEAPVK